MIRSLAAVVLGVALALAGCAPIAGRPAAHTGVFPSASVQTQRFSVEIVGQGPDVILIPGLGSPPAVWGATVAQLRATHRLHLVHVAGMAGMPPRSNTEGPVVAGLAQGLAEYIDREGLQKPAVIGHSMGGFAGLLLAARHPDRVGRLMVVDALPFFSVLITPVATEALMRPQAEAAAGRMLAQDAAAFRESQVRAMARLVTAPADQERAVEWSVESDRAVLARTMAEVMTTDARLEIARITADVTVLAAYDPATMPFPAASVEAVWRANYAALPRARVQMVAGARHFIMQDQPAAFAEAVRAFLAPAPGAP